MEDILKSHLIELITISGFVVATVIYALHKLEWLKMPQKEKEEDEKKWDGHERRECVQHPLIQQKVCSLYAKLEDLDSKLDTVSEKLQYILGALENRWGKKL